MKTRISPYQATLLLVSTIIGTAIVLLPTLIVQDAKQDAWLSGIILIAFALIISIIYSLIANRMERTDLIAFSRQTFGQIITTILTGGLVIYFVITSGTVTRQISEIMVSTYLPETPLWFLNLNIILTAAAFVYYGLEVTARVLEIIFYLFLVTFLIAIIILTKDMSPAFLQPVLSEGFKPILKSIYPGLVIFGEFFIVLIFAPQIAEPNKVYKSLVSSIAISGVLMMIVILSTLMIFGPGMTANLTFPLLSAHRYAQALGVIERLDPLFIFYWVGGGVLKAAIFFYGAVYTIQKLFRLSTYYIIIPFTIPPIFYISSYYFKNVRELADFLHQMVPLYIAIQVVYPILLLIFSTLRGVDSSD
ncbi:GerAB/ArcD/ProY family transporter [Acetohalobium arabaticum]|uniref:Spore germination protein n=1 Tax=Acetohalobium arabaticum (strain ATCC 49924 / DSM 5501 / Z-7288) TaxID=574087 RepID=D9QSI3_ACEAZ|nr:endospore germination permease [Acetohalobium arabaticum]ADL13446.1 spore germination protein [Acetohalobium arabaticum DSM 5501]